MLLINPSRAQNKKLGRRCFYFYERLGYPLPPFRRLKRPSPRRPCGTTVAGCCGMLRCDGIFAQALTGCGCWNRTSDLWVMSPTSYHFSDPRCVVPQGFEPQFSGPKPDVLPLHHRTIYNLQYVKEPDSLCIDYYTIFQRSGTSGEIRTPINGFGDRYATIAPHTYFGWNSRI